MSNAMLSLSGASLRALATPEAQAELARRQAKREASGKAPTIVQLKSWGRTSEAEVAIAAAKARKPAKVAKVVLTRTTEVVPRASKALTPRPEGLEKSMLALAGAVQAQGEVLRTIAAKLLA